MNNRIFWTAALVGSLCLTGCSAISQSIVPTAQTQTQDFTFRLKLEGYSTKTSPYLYSSYDVHHVDVLLLRQENGVYQPIHKDTKAVLSSIDDPNAIKVTVTSPFDSHPLVMRGLVHGGHYKLLGRAYTETNQLISKDDSACELAIDITNDNAVTCPALSIAIIDTPFNANTQLTLTASRPKTASTFLVSLLKGDGSTLCATKSFAVGTLPATMSAGNLHGNTDYKIRVDGFNSSNELVGSYTKNYRVDDDDAPANIAIDMIPALVKTLAGTAYSGSPGSTDGQGATARFKGPIGIAVGADDSLYVADSENYRIRKVDPSGNVTTLAGSTYGNADGTGSNAQFRRTYDVAVDSTGNVLVCDPNNTRICKVTPQGVVSTVATGTLYPVAMAIDSNDNLFVCQNSLNSTCKQILKVTPAGEASVFAGGVADYADGTGTAARFSSPNFITIDSSNNLYVVDSSRIRKITPDQVVSTLPGNYLWVSVDSYGGIAADNEGGLYISQGAAIIRRDIATGADTRIIGTPGDTYDGYGSSDGAVPDARLGATCRGMKYRNGKLYFDDYNHNNVRYIQF